MEFNQKLQQLRRSKGLTQEELAEKLFVSRTAVSKWESGRGYPNLDSLKEIANIFSVTVDELLKSNEILTIAEEDGKQKSKRLRTVVFGLLDLSLILLFFLPFFAEKKDGMILSVSLLNLYEISAHLRYSYIILTLLTVAFGVLTLALSGDKVAFFERCKESVSLTLSTLLVLLFIVSLQPYASVFALVVLFVKVGMLVKGQRH